MSKDTDDETEKYLISFKVPNILTLPTRRAWTWFALFLLLSHPSLSGQSQNIKLSRHLSISASVPNRTETATSQLMVDDVLNDVNVERQAIPLGVSRDGLLLAYVLASNS